MTAIEWRPVPAGPFAMGSDPGGAYPPDRDEAPRHHVTLAPFRLARLPVTNRDYRAFAKATGACFDHEVDDDLPATYVSLEEATAFCDWAGVRLPTEAEWEAAARGGDDRLWPWGDEPPDATRAVFDSGIGRPRRPGGHPAGASAHGVLDLAGNVQEWVSTRFGPYPAEDRLPARGELGVVRGGSFLHGPNELRCSYRQPMLAGARDHYVGFRVAAGPEPSQVPFEWIDIPGGVVALGRDTTASLGPALGNEIPIHLVELEAIELGLTPVTNAQYAAFVAETGAEAPAGWPQGSPPAGREDHPVAFVDWFDARAFCAWGGGRLPTEAEWEKAARGIDGRLYPWGAADEPARAHIGAGLKEGTTASVAAHPDGAGPYGLLDLVGNVWEWVSSAYRPYPYDPTDGREDPGGSEERVLRGGSFASRDLSFTRSATRSHSSPRRRQSHIGFRIARDGRS